MISYLADSVKVPAFSKRKVSAWIKQVAALQNYKVGNVSYIFCSDEKILEVNQQYLQHDYYTDIITFDYTEGKKISGDIFISLDTVRSNATKYAQSYEQELLRVMIHGILHLCGQNDKTAVHKAEMTKKENNALFIFGKSEI
jgi:rRNA maturation RNase YbeY